MTKLQTLLDRHNAEMARANAAAMERHFPECIEICSEMLTSGDYEEMAAASDESKTDARRCRAEARLTMATAMHYAEYHYEDILRVLKAALDSPPSVQKDVHFTTAVIHASFDNFPEARLSMHRCLELIAGLQSAGQTDEAAALQEQEREGHQFLAELDFAENGGGRM